jgi:multidrug resistance efflux pump
LASGDEVPRLQMSAPDPGARDTRGSMAETRKPSGKHPSAYRRPLLRSGLRVVYDNPVTGKGQVRIVDPRNGRQFAFTERENRMCQAADGKADIDTLCTKLATEIEGGVRPAEVTEFFRRLQILGLLDTDHLAADSGAPAAPERDPAAAAATPSAGPSARGPGGRPLRGPLSPRSAAPQGTSGIGPGAADAPLPGPPARQTAAPRMAARRSAMPRTAMSQGAAVQPTSSQPASSETVTRLDQLRPRQDRATDPAPGKETAAPPGADMTQDKADPLRPVPESALPPEAESDPTDPVTPEPTLLGDIPPDQAAPGPLPGFDFFDENFGPFPGDAGAGAGADIATGAPGMAGGLRGNPGGMGLRGRLRGGMMAGGGMPGGMIGAMRGGMPGGMMRGPFGQGGMLGGMQGGMGPAVAPGAPPGARTKKPAQMHLFDPGGLLKLIYILFYPLKLILWAILPLVVLAGLSLLNNLDAFVGDVRTILSDVSSVAQFAIGLFIVNLVSRIAQGVAIVAHGGKVPSFGIVLVLGLLPRFYIDKGGIGDLDRRGQLWAHGAPLLARLAIFALGTLTWAITREQGGMLPVLALIAAQFGLITFLMTSWPLMLSDGSAWLSVLFNEPRLMPKAAMAFKHLFLRGRLPPTIRKKDVLPLALYAVGVILSMTLVLGVMATSTLIYLERWLDGLGVLIFLGMAAASTLWLLALWGSVRARRPAGTNGAAFDKAAFRMMLEGRVPGLAEVPDAIPGADPQAGPLSGGPAAEAEPEIGARARVVWGVIMLGLAILAFQPYTYEAGGHVEIMPAARAQAVARTEGEILSVAVSEGDIVTRGQVLGDLSSWDQERQIRVTEAELSAAEASLARLLDGPKPEEVEVARRQLDSARASVAYSRAEAERARELADTGTGTQQNADKAQSALDSDLASLAVSEANLELVMSGATENDIAIARAEVERLTAELAFRRDELERTQIVAPMDGRVVTADLQLLTGNYLRVGDPLLEIENASMVSAVIAVPESDIALIAPGKTVRLKAWGQSDIEIEGTVQSIAPAAQEEAYGNVVRVSAVFPNPDDFLRSGMTGYAKIDGAEMRTWEAYLRSIRRFFQIEVWSWIP